MSSFLCVFLLSTLCAAHSIRINIGRSTVPLTITGEGLQTYPSDTITLKAGPQGILVQGHDVGKTLTLQANGLIRVLGKSYRHHLEVIWQKGPELLLVHELDLEDYLVGIVASEVSPSWPLEALKAQAIAARTYAYKQMLRKKDTLFHVVSTFRDQVYAGTQKEHPKAQQAVQETSHQILSYEGSPIEAYYHSTCGGHTESAKGGWGKVLSYLPGTSCTHCASSSTYRWHYSLSRKALDKALKGVFGSHIEGIEIEKSTDTGRVKTLHLIGRKKSKTIPFDSFRNALGMTKIRSNFISDLKLKRQELVISGKGYGHGVGLCQFGAFGLAKAGKSADEILQYYYPNTSISMLELPDYAGSPQVMEQENTLADVDDSVDSAAPITASLMDSASFSPLLKPLQLHFTYPTEAILLELNNYFLLENLLQTHFFNLIHTLNQPILID